MTEFSAVTRMGLRSSACWMCSVRTVNPLIAESASKRLTLGYREVESRTDNPLMRRGQRVRAHEFHWSTLEEPPAPENAVYRVVDQENRADGFHVGSVWASYVHIHLGSRKGLAARFVETCTGKSA